MTHTMYRRIIRHPRFTVCAYAALSAAGYENSEILAIWNRR